MHFADVVPSIPGSDCSDSVSGHYEHGHGRCATHGKDNACGGDALHVACELLSKLL